MLELPDWMDLHARLFPRSTVQLPAFHEVGHATADRIIADPVPCLLAPQAFGRISSFHQTRNLFHDNNRNHQRQESGVRSQESGVGTIIISSP